MESLECPQCQRALEDLGEYNFRVGGATGVGGFLLGGLNQLAQDRMTFDLRICPTCREVKFFLRQ